jgi:hypothetical protein
MTSKSRAPRGRYTHVTVFSRNKIFSSKFWEHAYVPGKNLLVSFFFKLNNFYFTIPVLFPFMKFQNFSGL